MKYIALNDLIKPQLHVLCYCIPQFCNVYWTEMAGVPIRYEWFMNINLHPFCLVLQLL